MRLPSFALILLSSSKAPYLLYVFSFAWHVNWPLNPGFVVATNLRNNNNHLSIRCRCPY
jgi:hypothetical protein